MTGSSIPFFTIRHWGKDGAWAILFRREKDPNLLLDILSDFCFRFVCLEMITIGVRELKCERANHKVRLVPATDGAERASKHARRRRRIERRGSERHYK